MYLVTAKPIEWEEQRGTNWADSVYGVHIYYDEDDVPGEKFTAAWGEGDAESFATLQEAMDWCQEQIDEWIGKVAVVTEI